MKFRKIFSLIIFFMVMFLLGCNNGNIKNVEPIFKVECEEILYYSQVCEIKITSTYEEDEYYIESLNSKIVQINKGENDLYFAEAIGLGETEIYVSNNYGKEVYIAITVYAKEGVPSPIENIDLLIREEGPYYIGQTYHLDMNITPKLYDDIIYYIDSDMYTINKETNEIVFLRTGVVEILLKTKKNQGRYILKVDTIVDSKKNTYEVLFIGNSLTSMYDIPVIVSDMVKADGGYMAFSQCIPGNTTLAQKEGTFNYLTDLHDFSHIVLQGQSMEPLAHTQEFYDAVVKLGNKGKEKGAEILMYQTWGYNYEDSNYKKNIRLQLQYVYDNAAKLIDGKVSRVGEAFTLFEETYGCEPSLYRLNDINHQSEYGAYLAACVHYTMITGKKASGNTYVYPEIDAEWVSKIQEIADKITFK